MRYLSLCSGIEAATVAWRSLGWQPVAFAEIEPFPCAVLKHHYPEIPNLGDITRIDGSRYRGAVDLVVGGTPCQDFSIAGQRAGLAGERGGLALVFTQILSVVRPEWVVWENVPGVFSTNGGRDFGAFLRALDDIGYSCAWRVLDAQFFGVPQRRRRVYIVGHLGDWRPAAAVLFEPQSLRGNTAPCKKKRTDVTQSLTRCLGAGGADDNRAQGGFYVSHIVGQAMSCKWAKGTSGPAGDEYHNLVCAPVAPTVTSSGPPYERTGNSRVEADALIVSQHSGVRRITPRECERLQGFPDDYTAIPFRGKPAADCPDGPRYKALGNSMAVPVMRWIGQRIENQTARRR